MIRGPGTQAWQLGESLGLIAPPERQAESRQGSEHARELIELTASQSAAWCLRI